MNPEVTCASTDLYSKKNKERKQLLNQEHRRSLMQIPTQSSYQGHNVHETQQTAGFK